MSTREHYCPRLSAMLAIIALAGACRATDDEARSLVHLDPAEASLRVRGWTDSCAGFTRALGRLTSSKISGRLLAALTDDVVERGRERCATPADTIVATGVAEQLARARLADDRPAAALAALASATAEPAIRFRRAELLDRLGRTHDAVAELDLAQPLDEMGRDSRRTFQLTLDVRAGRHREVARAIADAALPDRVALAYRAATDAPLDALDALVAAAGTEPELAAAVGDRLERERGPVAALAARERAAAAAPDDAEVQDAFARSLAAAHRIDDALVAWDHAAELAPAQPTYRLAPVRALVALGHRERAVLRATAFAELARSSADIEQLVTASGVAAAAGDSRGAIELARDARARRPGDGRLAFGLADRLAEAGDRAMAADGYAELLACGAHGRPWHRHEVAGKLVALAIDAASAQLAAAALRRARSCVAVEVEDLARYRATALVKIEAIRGD